MQRLVLSIATALTIISTAALADDKSDCQKGVAMIKSELARKHPESVLAKLRSALGDAEGEVKEEDWPECLDAIKPARAALGR